MVRARAFYDTLVKMLPAHRGVAVWPAALIVWGPGFNSMSHRHHCVQLVMALRRSLRVRRGAGDEWRRCSAVLVPPDVVHQIDARGDTILIAFIDAESELGGAMRGRATADITRIAASIVAGWRSALGVPPTGRSVQAWIEGHLLGLEGEISIDPRVQQVLAHLRQAIGMSEDLSLPGLATLVGLSPSRLMHLFTASVGVPLRPYIRWLRLQCAARELIRGASISAAAHRAGFSDAAHLTRTFREMLGINPSDTALQKLARRGFHVDHSTITPVGDA